MYRRTEITWLYWSRGEASFFYSSSWMKIGSWTMWWRFEAFESWSLSDVSSSLVRLGLRCAPAPCQHRSSGSLVLPQVPHLE